MKACKKVDLFGMMFVINGNFKWMRNKQKHCLSDKDARFPGKCVFNMIILI